MKFDKNDVQEFRDLVSKGSTPEQAKQILQNDKQDGFGVTNAFVDISSNIYKGFENLSADAINVPLKMFGSDKRVKPVSEALFPAGEEYEGGILQRSADTISQRGEELGEAVTLSTEGEQTTPEGVFQGVSKTARGVLDIGGDVFVSTLSTLTPDKQKEQLENKIKEIAETEGGQAAIQFGNQLQEDYKIFKENNPRAGRNVDALGTVLEGAAEIATGYLGYKGIKSGIKEGKHLGAEGVGKLKSQMEKIVKEKETAQVDKKVSNTMEPGAGKKLRETEEIAGNILQPYKGMTENLADANKGLQRVILETDIVSNKNTTFGDLVVNTRQLLSKYGRMLDKELKSVPGTYKDSSIDSSLKQLLEVYEGTSSRENREIFSKLSDYQSKSTNQGLTASEINDLKVLHTKANSLFNEKGQATGGFASDDLRSIRKELKLLVENIASENGVTNIKEINKTYGELSDAKGLLDNQIKNLKAYKGRTLPETLGSKIGNIVGRIPVLSGGVRGALSELGVTLRSDKINPIEVQKRLPKLIEELNKAGMSRGEVNEIQEQLSEALKQLPGEGETSFREGPVITPQTAERSIIAESKKELENAKISLNQTNTKAEMYDEAKLAIQEVDIPEDLLDLKDYINSLGLARKEELNKQIDTKIKAIKEINELEATGQQLRNEYGDDLIQSFKEIYKNELNLKTTKGANKYSEVEFNTTPGFQRFSKNAEEYISANPWLEDKSVQDIYDELKDKMLEEDISTLNKVTQLERKDAMGVLDGLTKTNIKTTSKKLASKLRTSEVDTIQKTISEFVKKYGNEFKEKIGELLDEIAEKVGARINLMSSKNGTGKSLDDFESEGTAMSVSDDLLKELNPIIKAAKKYDNVEEFKNDFMSADLLDISNPKQQRWGRLFEDGVDEDTGRYMDAKYTADIYGKRGNNVYKWQSDANLPDVNSPNDTVTIYRSTNKKQKEMLPGDFVSFSKDYAEMHNTDGHTLELKVPAKDVVWQGNDFNEWIYSPETLRGKMYDGGLEKIFKKANPGMTTKDKGVFKAPETIDIEATRKNDKAIKSLKDKGYSGIENSRGRIDF